MWKMLKLILAGFVVKKIYRIILCSECFDILQDKQTSKLQERKHGKLNSGSKFVVKNLENYHFS